MCSPKGRPGGPQEHQKGTEEDPQTLSRPCSAPISCLGGIVCLPSVKFRFLKLGGSTWELKSNPKRLHDKKNDYFEGAQKGRSGQKDNNKKPIKNQHSKHKKNDSNISNINTAFNHKRICAIHINERRPRAPFNIAHILNRPKSIFVFEKHEDVYQVLVLS